jgi:PAS domain S-box-containing protein
MLLWWGPEYISIYNDAYRPILGRKHPWGLGQPVRECWSEIWDVLKPLIDTPFCGGPATWVEDIELQINRSGLPEETHFTIAYSPVPDETAPGGIGGVLATVHEITEKVVAQRRVGLLRDLGTRTAEAKTPEEACRMAAATLAPHAKDIPFALFYVIDETGKPARLVASCGVPAEQDLSPLVSTLHESAPKMGQMQILEDLSSRVACVPQGPWSDPPRQAVIVPIPSRLRHLLAGYLVAGLSSHLAFDDEYKSFLELATSQVATAIANAKAYEEERKRAEALAEIDRAKTVFFSNVSHEFRTPLTLLLGPLEDALARAGELPGALRVQLEVAHRNSLRLLRLVNSLLDFSRIEAGRVRAVYESTDLSAMTTDLASSFRSATERAGLERTVNCAPLLEPVYVDREMWEKIVLNLLSNAFKFTFRGGIAVHLCDAGDHVNLVVTDTGTGIPEAELPHLFTRFHRVRSGPARTYEGTGIGLALVQELVRLHGGTVRVESALGKGTTFTVSVPFGNAHLPAEQVGGVRYADSTAVRSEAFVEEALQWLPGPQPRPEAIRAASEVGAPDKIELRAAGKGRKRRDKVLVVDDNADMRNYLVRMLAGQYDVVTATCGDEALRIAFEERPDLMLADVMMPGMDGFDLLRSIRSDPATQTMLVILLSARAGDEARTEGMKAGADDYLVKPFSAREILARIGGHLELTRVRREAEQALKESRDRLAMALAIARAGSFDLDLKTNIVVWSEELQELYGIGPNQADVKMNDWLEWVLPDDRERVLADLGAGLKDENVTSQFRIRRQDTGEVRWIEGRGRTVRDSDGKPLRMVGFSIDISEQKRAEEALRASEARERARAAELEGILDAVPMAMFIARDPNASNIAGSRMTYEVLRLPLGANISFLLSKDASPSCRFMREGRNLSFRDLPVPTAASTGQTIRDYEFELIYEDGTRRNMLGDAVPLFDGQGHPRGAVGAFIDITERKRTEEGVRRTQRLEGLGALANGIAHDFNNLLGAVSAQAELALAEFDSGSNVIEELNAIRDVAMRGSEIVRELMIYAGTESQTLVLLDISRVIEGMSELLKISISKHAMIETELARDLPVVRANSARISQLVMNLVTNASDAIGDRNGVIRVITRRVASRDGSPDNNSGRPDDCVQLEVSDTGCGMPSEMQARVFEPFFSTKSTGRGLGLAVVDGIVRSLGGIIQLKSEPGKGTTIQISLPCAGTDSTRAPEVMPKGVDLPPRSVTDVLLVEDETPLLQGVSKLLRKKGVSVIEAADGAAALDVIRNKHCPLDVIVLDITIPGASSREVFEEARRLRPQAKVIVTSAYTRDVAAASLQAPIQQFLRKPYRLGDLLDLILRTAS